jgi:hypothetical protein
MTLRIFPESLRIHRFAAAPRSRAAPRRLGPLLSQRMGYAGIG